MFLSFPDYSPEETLCDLIPHAPIEVSHMMKDLPLLDRTPDYKITPRRLSSEPNQPRNVSIKFKKRPLNFEVNNAGSKNKKNSVKHSSKSALLTSFYEKENVPLENGRCNWEQDKHRTPLRSGLSRAPQTARGRETTEHTFAAKFSPLVTSLNDSPTFDTTPPLHHPKTPFVQDSEPRICNSEPPKKTTSSERTLKPRRRTMEGSYQVDRPMSLSNRRTMDAYKSRKETELRALMRVDPKKAKRVMANRQSACKSRDRQLHRTLELENYKDNLKVMLADMEKLLEQKRSVIREQELTLLSRK
eukprot:CAMPEP_0196592116 /NCGR_PEP_ID=MMETSP1081-20130531/71743_1 /TAXON_ID=36882 /ORGANISM="Pyramimonas amylifera, Strain CCMP720" /LENGTH=301 /DNA_ID=CAMNT_0041915697 /DNA_START=710 /DNA_END=1615 /DNA_ORIENTATION=+